MNPETEGVVTREPFRIGKRTGQKLWQIKEAPGWSVVHQAKTLVECADWLKANGHSLLLIPVLTAGDWRSLNDWLKSKKEPQ